MPTECRTVKLSPNSLDAAGASPIPPLAYLIYETSFESILGEKPEIEVVDERQERFAHEAGVYIHATRKEYFTSNYQSGKVTRLFEVDCDTREVHELHVPPQLANANGACLYKDENVLFCCQGSLAVPSALVLYRPALGVTNVILDNYYGRQFNSLNDVVVHPLTGDIWFTDPSYGFEQAFRPPPQLPSQVYRFQPSTGKIWCVADGFAQCNGLCFSPDLTAMYITDTGATQAHGGPGDGHNFSFNPRLPSTIYKYDVIDQKKLGNRQVFAHCTVGVPDGIKCDRSGNVYSGCGDGVHVWDPHGTLLGKIYIGSLVGNLNFDPSGLWIMAEQKLVFARLQAKDKRLVGPEVEG